MTLEDIKLGPFDTYDDAEIEAARVAFKAECEFVKGVVDMEGLPPTSVAEIALAGRSNVGKSSLINALTDRKILARTSNTPGRTRELNFFNLNQDLQMVDMPGYGYAKAAKTEISAWNALIRDYLRGRMQLKRVFMLIDSRHGIKSNDIDIMKMLDRSAVSYQIILTKLDKVPKGEQEKLFKQTSETLAKRPAAHPFILATSSAKGWGLDKLRAEMMRLV
ncbi:MAG: YihA family ribosome biogenesis GTP-binding protein [Rhizobiales bacterium]|nr:ribosome biogenesis GTP-binding protein YihA/YsxC [Hyphomicrobiales bacterium]NRB14286.1 YihA family ribosome biogenesis GTP-binding protein [Hyphomicrobiales bacterium]